ncbi:hypothetical protein AVEN_187115-1 [Araneus ventricosus]|uniref:Uncharacterized protein n=1 Tax=Araneus ventricosus TaxID=182803 RepID=A0A4Y2ETJ4_ARAVE|nr:hypothetical protein AVEN_187115-1 [Araneus ventricosus]
MDKKLSTEISRRSPYFCSKEVRSSALIRRVLLITIVILCSIFVALILCGALYATRNSVFFYVAASVLFSAATMLILFYIWLSRRCPFWKMDYPAKAPSGKMEISTVNGFNYYSQVPNGVKSDFPMGPYLVMTLPKTHNHRDRSGTIDSEDCSAPNTPRYMKRKSLRRAKNLPPLASAETLTPSLISSSYGSIDSVV